MFKLFERQPNWALKQLVQETDQPAVCLSLICSRIVQLCTKNAILFIANLLKEAKQIDIVQFVHIH